MNVSIYSMPDSVFAPTETTDRLTGYSRSLPRIKLIGRSPSEIEQKIYYRAADKSIHYVKWTGLQTISDDYTFVPGNGKWGHFLPIFEGYYYFDPSQYAFNSIGEDWQTAVKTLVKAGKATVFVPDNSQAIADGVEAAIKRNKPKPKRTSDKQWGVNAADLQEMKDNSRF